MWFLKTQATIKAPALQQSYNILEAKLILRIFWNILSFLWFQIIVWPGLTKLKMQKDFEKHPCYVYNILCVFGYHNFLITGEGPFFYMM